MSRARIKPDIFKKCEIVLLFNNDKITAYAGFKHNPWLDCKTFNGVKKVFISGHWKSFDVGEWEIMER